MNVPEIMRYLLDPKPADAGWNTRPPEWMTRERSDLEPNALDAVARETGIFWLNFHDMIAPAIAIYLRASGLESIREDFQRINEHCDRLEERCRLMAIRDGNLWQSCSVFAGEADRERRRAKELEKLLDSALAAPQGARP